MKYNIDKYNTLIYNIIYYIIRNNNYQDDETKCALQWIGYMKRDGNGQKVYNNNYLYIRQLVEIGHYIKGVANRYPSGNYPLGGE